VWSPSNLRKVTSYGAEANVKANFSSGKYKLKTELLYSLARSVNQTDEDPLFDDKQLAYVPLHSGRLFASLMIIDWSFDTRLNFTGIRYTTIDNERSQALDPYALLDASISRRFSPWKMNLLIRVEALNLFDVYYENLKNHAMPGRHYALSILLKLDNKQHL
jgi:iron complex outermembrane receptor protein